MIGDQQKRSAMPTMMTIGDLKKAIEKLDDSLQMTAILDRGNEPFELLDIECVEIHSGTPKRGEDGDRGFKFETPGLVKWAFVTVTRESGD
jgi:hypothetical protein